MSDVSTYVLKRNLGGENDLQPGEYCTLADQHIARTTITVVICCQICAKKRRLDHKHVVAKDGKVTPALTCEACPFFEWVVLDGWGATA